MTIGRMQTSSFAALHRLSVHTEIPMNPHILLPQKNPMFYNAGVISLWKLGYLPLKITSFES